MFVNGITTINIINSFLYLFRDLFPKNKKPSNAENEYSDRSFQRCIFLDQN